MGLPTPGHGGGWAETFVAFLGWALILIVVVMLLGVAIPIIAPIALFGIGCYCYSLFIDKE